MKKIPLTQSKFALVDDSNYNWLNRWKWYAHKDRNTYYAKRWSKGATIKMHRLLLGLKADDPIRSDHIDGDGLNNQRHNLRVATVAQNTQHSYHPRGKSKYKGLDWQNGQKNWRVRIQADGKRMTLGYFTNEIVAAHVYDRAAIEHHREFARLNFPREVE